MTKPKRKKTHIASDSLTPKQESFCQYYIDTGSAPEAYRMSYSTENMKWESIRVNANKLLHDAKIIRRLEELRIEEAAQSRIDRAKIEKVLFDIANVDPADMYVIDEKTGKTKLKSPSQMPKNVRNALKSIKNNKGVVSYEFNGKTEAARLLGSWNGWDAPTQIDVRSSKSSELRIGFDDDYNDE